MIRVRSIVMDMRFQVATLLILFISAYWVPLTSMFNTWMKNEDYSYGFLIPLLSIYLIWDMRARLKGIRPESSWAILPVLVLLVLLSVYGILGSSGNISMPLIPVLIIGFTAFCFGIGTLRRLILPLGLLFFMVPIPAVIERTIGMYLKVVSSELGGLIIRLCNISVHVSGNIIDLGVTQLQVADACNGLRYVFPLLALGILYSYFFERTPWKRLFCVISTVPIAVAINAFRIGLTGILTVKYGPEAAEGFFHGFSGWIMFVAAFCLLFLIGRILRIFPPRDTAKPAPGEPAYQAGKPDYTKAHSAERTDGAFITSVIMLAIVSSLSLSTKALPEIKLKGGIAAFDTVFSDWKGKTAIVDPKIVDLSGAQEAFSGVFQNSSGEDVALYIGYRGTAFLANENFFHSPTVCLPASGWIEESVSTRVIENVPHFGKLKVTRMVISILGSKEVVYFWFQTKSKTTYDKNINRFDLAMHAIRRDNTYDMFIRTITPVKMGEDIETAQQRMDAFVRDMMKALMQFIDTGHYTETGR